MNLKKKSLYRLLLCMCLLFFQVTESYAQWQNRLELGIFTGLSYYIGDLNPGKQFYHPSIAFGGVGRYVIDDRYAIKGEVLSGGLKGTYSNKSIVLPSCHIQKNKVYSFNRNIMDASVQLEFNFVPYDHWFYKKTKWTPYVSLGVGTAIYKRISNTLEKTHFILSLPFGVGLKYKIQNRVRLAAEWSFRKTTVDDLDVEANDTINPNNPYGFKNNIHNNDWYSFVGVMITVSIVSKKTPCNCGFKR